MFKTCAKLIARHGFAGAGIRLIAAELNVSTASFFHLFASKNEMLNELIAFAAKPSFSFYARLMAIDAPPEIALYKSLYEETFAVASADRDFIALFYLPELRQSEFSSAQRVRSNMVAHYRQLIEQGIKSQMLRAVSPGLAAEQVFQLTETSIISSMAISKIDPAIQAKDTADLCLRAFLKDVNQLKEVQDKAMRLPPRIVPPNL